MSMYIQWTRIISIPSDNKCCKTTNCNYHSDFMMFIDSTLRFNFVHLNLLTPTNDQDRNSPYQIKMILKNNKIKFT